MRQSRIDQIVAKWKRHAPSFLWAPTGPDDYLRDQARGMVGKLNGRVSVIRGGLAAVSANSDSSWIEFPTNAGITAGNLPFVGVMLVSVVDPAAVGGCFLKIGNTSGGLGFGAGNTTFENSGSKMIVLQEGVAWNVGASSTLAAGLNVLTFGYTSEVVLAFKNATTGTNADVGGGGTLAPSANLYINGYTLLRGSNAVVHAVALFSKSVTNTEYNDESARLAKPAYQYGRTPRRGVRQLFQRAPRDMSYLAAVAGAIPTLSLPTVTGITATGATPRVTITF